MVTKTEDFHKRLSNIETQISSLAAAFERFVRKSGNEANQNTQNVAKILEDTAQLRIDFERYVNTQGQNYDAGVTRYGHNV